MEQRESPQEEPRVLAPRITSDPDVMQGKPVIAGSRLTVEKLLENLACGDTFADLQDAYPFLTTEDVAAAIAYAARLAGQSPRPMSDKERAAS
jgi:uncharacterized protein (DUF433 family)